MEYNNRGYLEALPNRTQSDRNPLDNVQNTIENAPNPYENEPNRYGNSSYCHEAHKHV